MSRGGKTSSFKYIRMFFFLWSCYSTHHPMVQLVVWGPGGFGFRLDPPKMKGIGCHLGVSQPSNPKTTANPNHRDPNFESSHPQASKGFVYDGKLQIWGDFFSTSSVFCLSFFFEFSFLGGWFQINFSCSSQRLGKRIQFDLRIFFRLGWQKPKKQK